MDNIINVKIKNRIATVAPGEFIVCGNEDYSIAFDFDDEWSGIYTKTARFYHNGRYEDYVFTGNTVAAPEFANITHVEVGVFAEEITTTPARIPCLKSILCRGGLVYEPPDDVYAQIIALVNELSEKGATDEQIASAVERYLDENPVEAGATAEQAAQIAQNAADIAEIKQSGGVSGEDGATFTPSVSADGTLSWTNDKGLSNPKPVNIKGEKGDTGDPGDEGADGFSPLVEVSAITGGHRVTITDAAGVTTFDVMNGVNGSGGDGSGDMLMSIYDRDGNGVVDNAEKLGGHSPDHFAQADHSHDEYMTEESDPTVPSWAKAAKKPSYTAEEVGAAKSDHVHGNMSASGHIGTETGQFVMTTTDGLVTTQPPEAAGAMLGLSAVATSGSYGDLKNKPTIPVVPEWAKAETKPSYTAEEVGAIPDTTLIPTKISQLENDAGFGGGGGTNYSDTEELTGGTWFDGKPLYRISKYYSNVVFAGVGQWTTVGDLPIDVSSSQYKVVDICVWLLMGISSVQTTCAGVRLPIYDAGGALSSPWMMSGTQLAYNWRGNVTKPFDKSDVLVTLLYTKN